MVGSEPTNESWLVILSEEEEGNAEMQQMTLVAFSFSETSERSLFLEVSFLSGLRIQ